MFSTLQSVLNSILSRISPSYAAFLHSRDQYLSFLKCEDLSNKVYDLSDRIVSLSNDLQESERKRVTAETALLSTQSRVSELSMKVMVLEERLQKADGQKDLKMVLNWVSQGAWGRPIFPDMSGLSAEDQEQPAPPPDAPRAQAVFSSRRAQMRDLAAMIKERLSSETLNPRLEVVQSDQEKG